MTDRRMRYGADHDDPAVRTAAFDFLARQADVHGETVPHDVLLKGFEYHGRRVPLLGPQGIFKPAVLPRIALSITTAPVAPGKARPYDDEVSPDGTLLYRYRGTDPEHPENVGLRLAMQRATPLVYLFGVVPGQYAPVWPVYVVGDNPGRLTFSIDLDAQSEFRQPKEPSWVADRRRYAPRVTQQRLHQVAFRLHVLTAYRESCAICRLRHPELMDAAHILPDGHPRGLPVVPNGLALCKLHHAAFDANFIGVRPDLVVEVRRDILEEEDGPMLRHGLQAVRGTELVVPRSKNLRPDRNRLEERYELFRKAS